MRRGIHAAVIALVLAVAGVALAADGLVGALEAEDPRAVEAAVTAIEHAPTTPELAEALFAAGRVCEDRLLDPARAVALYDRLVRELPDARVAAAALRRAERLHATVGEHGEHAREAGELAHLIADADRLAADEVVRRADALVTAPWPGASEAALWLAEWLRRHGQWDAAQTRYALVTARWPATPQALVALRGAAGCAIDAGDWDRAEALASQLPAADMVERTTRDDLLEAAARGRRRAHLYLAAWLGLALALAGLVASLADAALRGGRRRPALRPPIEVLFLAPVAAVLVIASFTAHRAIGPAVLRISLAGLALTWLSGTTLDLVRARGRAVRLRAVLHIVACMIGVVAIGYIAMTRDGLLELLVETVRFGPDA